MHEEIDRVFSKMSSEKIVERLDKADIANAKLNSMRQFWDHPQLEARDRWREVDTPAGPIEAMKPPFNLDGFEPRMDAIPALGAQSGAILSELGFAAGEIQRMEASGIIQLGGKP
jgi:itaconate CoA-transferase